MVGIHWPELVALAVLILALALLCAALVGIARAVRREWMRPEPPQS